MAWSNALVGYGEKLFGGLKSSEQGYDEAMGSINAAYDRANRSIQPYQDYGTQSLADLRQFTTGDPTEAVLNDPTYQFGYDQGLNAVNNSAAANNRLLSGRTLKELTQYGQDYGMSKYDDILNRKVGLADWGYNTGAGKSADLAIGQGNALAGLQTGKGDAKQSRYQGYFDLLGGAGGTAAGYFL